MSSNRLRVIDFGRVSPLRSQTLWHAIAHGVSAGAPPTLALMQPAAPYVSIGYHRRIEEVDRAECRRAGLPVYRRMVGGGPVYLDDGQAFFQIILPVADAPAVRSQAVRTLLAPAVDAFRAAGIDATIEEAGDVVVGDRKICGHGAGQIGEAVVVVGNLITSFDHPTATRIMAVPDAGTRTELESLMRRYVMATPVDPALFKTAVVASYASGLGLESREGALTDIERRALEAVDEEFTTDEWVQGPARPASPVWRVKVKAGVYLVQIAAGPSSVRVSIAGDRILRIRLVDPALNGATQQLESAAQGMTLTEGQSLVAGAGITRLATLLDGIAQATQR